MTDLGISPDLSPTVSDKDVLDAITKKCAEINKLLQIARARGLTVIISKDASFISVDLYRPIGKNS